MNMRKTVLIHTRHAWRSHRTQAAFNANHGFQIFTIEQLAARIAGGFLQPIDHDGLNIAVANALSKPLGELDTIKELPGFQRAAAATLSKLWLAGLDLSQELKDATEPAARERFEAFIALERHVLEILPKNQLRPRDLTATALKRVQHSSSIFGPIEIHGHTELAPVWRPLVIAIAKATKVSWIAGARHVPDWLRDSCITIHKCRAEKPFVKAVSCASPRHEILESIRWTRQHLARGANPQDIAIVAASPEAWDDHMLAHCEAANLPIHFAHGRAALSTFDGQLAAALAEVLLRGFSRTRITRLVALLRTHNTHFGDLPGNWWQLLPDDAPLLDATRWQRAIDAIPLQSFPDGADLRPVLAEIIENLAMGLAAAERIGELLLKARALAIWQKALSQGPAEALDVTLAGLRVDDGLEPEASILWGPASALAAVPRPLTWLVGLTSRTWPRRAAEDPLLPEHIVESSRLNPLPVHQADRRNFATIFDMTAKELVCSRARRDSEGRLNGISPLYPRNIEEIHLAQSREPEHAASATDRFFARPAEFATLPVARSALTTWIDWHTGRLTAHDGLVRAQHPLLMRALDRRQSASSLVKLLRDPLGYLWTYGFCWSEPEESDEPLKLDALSFGNLLHEILQEAVTRLEAVRKGGFAMASEQQIAQAVQNAARQVAAVWDDTRPVPPPVVWQRKCEEAIELAIVALSYQQESLPGQRSWAEIPFGGDRHGQTLDEETHRTLPWDPNTAVVISDTNITIGGAIDRLDLSSDGSQARVTDYKSGKLTIKLKRYPPQLNGGAELQRCLYAYAVKALLASDPQVEARLLYPREGGHVLELAEPQATLDKLATFLTEAVASFRAGLVLPGPAAQDRWYDLAFALPGGAKESYLDSKLPLVAQSLSAIAPLWDED
jgi:hypothetical protein